MAVSVQMPALGESVTEGTVTRWLKQEGDTVVMDEPLLEVSTDKVDTEIPAPASGVLTRIVAHEDDTVAVGGELGVIGEAGEVAAPATAPVAAAPPAARHATTQAKSKAGGRKMKTPSAWKGRFKLAPGAGGIARMRAGHRHKRFAKAPVRRRRLRTAAAVYAPVAKKMLLRGFDRGAY